jgi:hypothetical protein
MNTFLIKIKQPTIMKTSNLFRITLVAASLTFMFACKKDSQTSSSSPTTAANVQTAADDQTMASNEDEAMSNDATAALSSNASIAGSSLNSTAKSGGSTLGLGDIAIGCDATVAFDTTSDTKTVTITYSGSCLGDRTRSGTVVISIPKGVHWKDVGAAVSINVNLTVTRKRDGKSIVLKGTKTITNTSGGLLVDLATLTSVIHDITSSFVITFDNGTARTWNVSKHRVFSYTGGILVTTTGTYSDGTNSDIAEWGTNRFGVAFKSRITAPKVLDQSCDFRLTSGENTITRGDNITSVITYGLDATGNPTTCPGTGYYYAKLVWTNSATGKSYTFIYPY